MDFEPCGGDGVSGGDYGRAKLLGSLAKFLTDDPITKRKVETAMLLAPEEDQAYLREVIEDLLAGNDPGDTAVDAVLMYGDIFCAQTFRPGRKMEDDTGFASDEA